MLGCIDNYADISEAMAANDNNVADMFRGNVCMLYTAIYIKLPSFKDNFMACSDRGADVTTASMGNYSRSVCNIYR